MAFSQGFAKGTDVPIEHLDYDYIGKCEKASEVESILKILRSNQEGYYPELIKFTEDKLKELNPKSKLLIKTEAAKRLKDLASSDSRDIVADLEQWEHQMHNEEVILQDTPPDDAQDSVVNGELPPIRKACPITQDGGVGGVAETRGDRREERLQSSDYQAWDKYNVEQECAKLEEKREEKPQSHNKAAAVEVSLSEREASMSAMEKQRLAVREKEKGNEAFRAGDYEEALTYYSKSILLDESAPSYNNRALTFIKLQHYQEAIQDCRTVLKLEPTNTKALLRHGTALLGVKDWEGTEKVMQQLLGLEPRNKKAQEILKQASDEIAKSVKSEPKKGRRVQIEEVDEDDESVSKPAPPLKVEATPSSAPMPEDVVKWKEKGNDLFRKGQYDVAAEHYSKAIGKLETAGEGHVLSLSTLLNNRAACHLKNGNSQACVQDCTHSLQLVPVNIKALVRRAQAYEHMEKYRLAYVDNQLALSMDRNMDTVYASNNRISQHLKEQDGLNWRDKLPPHPDQQRVTQALNQQNSKDTAPQPPTSATTPPTSAPPPTQPSTATPPVSSAMPPPIMSSAATSLQTKVTQTTTAVPSSTPSPSHIPIPSTHTSKAEEFERAKTKGNEHAKKGQFLEALNCYSTCISACPDRVAGYTNRALCHLKLKSPASAERDCNKGLELEPNNIKALYRRALARKALGKYGESMKDLKQLLELDGENTVAKGEYAAVKQLWEKELRQLQDKNQKQKEKKSSHLSRKKSGQGHKQRAATKEREREKEKEKSMQQRELEQLLAETKNKMKELKKDPLAFAENPSEYLSASQTTYYKAPPRPGVHQQSGPKPQQSGPKPGVSGPKPGVSGPKPQQSGPKPGVSGPRRRKVVVEEEKDESPATAAEEGGGKNQNHNKRKDRSQGNTHSQPQASKVEPQPLQEEVDRSPALGVEGGKQSRVPEVERDQHKPETCTDPPEVGTTEPPEVETTKPPEVETTKPPKVETTKPPEVETTEPPEVETTEPPKVEATEMKSTPGDLLDTRSEVADTDMGSTSKDGQVSSPYEFVRQWNRISRGGNARDYADLLQQIPPKKLPEVITNKLEGVMLSNIISAISKQFLPQGRCQLCLEILENLTKVPRFQTIAMFLEKKEKAELGGVLSALEKREDGSKAAISNLRKLYGANT